jgi:hypothetical protein
MRMCCTCTCCGSTSGFTGIVPVVALVSSVTLSPSAGGVADESAVAVLVSSVGADAVESGAGSSLAQAVTANETRTNANRNDHPVRERPRRDAKRIMISPCLVSRG